MNNITLVKVMDDKVMAFVPEYSDNSIRLHSNLIQFIILLDYRPASICKHTNTGAAQAGLHNKQ